MDDKLSDFIERHKDDRAVAFKVARDESGLDLMSAEKYAEPGTLEGTLVAKTWAQGVSKMIWGYVIDDNGELRCFPTFKWAAGKTKPNVGDLGGIRLGRRITAKFEKNSKGNISCTSITAE